MYTITSTFIQHDPTDDNNTVLEQGEIGTYNEAVAQVLYHLEQDLRDTGFDADEVVARELGDCYLQVSRTMQFVSSLTEMVYTIEENKAQTINAARNRSTIVGDW